MAEKNYTIEDITNSVKSHAEYAQVQGAYSLTPNLNPLEKSLETLSFKCSEDQFEGFVNDIIEELNSLSEQKSQEATVEWAPFPGIRKAEMLKKYKDSPGSYPKMIKENPHIVIIEKTSDEGQSISWKFP